MQLRGKKKLVIYAAALAAGGYASYSLYKSEYFRERREKLARLIRGVYNLVESLSNVADSSVLISSEIKAFLHSDSDDVPQSVRQVFKLFQCKEFQDLVVASTTRVCKEVASSNTGTPRRSPSSSRTKLRALVPEKKVVIHPSNDGSSTSEYSSDGEEWTQKNRLVACGSVKANHGGIADGLLSRLFSDDGKGFASVVAGSAARSLVVAALEEMIRSRGLGLFQLEESSQSLLDLACTNKAKSLIADSIQMFVETAVSTYLDKTRDVNVFEEIVEAVTKPSYQVPVKDLLVAVSSGAVDTLVRTSHSVMSSGVPPSIGAPGDASSGSTGGDIAVETISKALAVPSNRKLVIEVAGTMTSEAVHSIFQIVASNCSPYFVNSRRAFKSKLSGLLSLREAKQALLVLMMFLAMFFHIAVNSRSASDASNV